MNHGNTFPAYDGQEEDRRNGDYRPSQNNYGGRHNQNNQGNQGGGERQSYGSQNNYNRNNGQGSQGGYNRNNYQNNNQGGYQNNGGQNNHRFERKPETDLSLYKPYAFTANNDIPEEVMSRICDIMRDLERRGYTLRTGGMEGPEDTAEKAVEKKEIHLPWKDFNEKKSKFTWTSERAMAVAKMFHPAFDSMKKGVQIFLAKNARLVLGNKVDSPALFLLTWTEDGAESAREKTARTGFSGHPISIASALRIPIFNFGREGSFDRFDHYLSTLDD